MRSRCRFLSVGLVVLLVATAGCSGILGEGPITGTASPATVSDSALSRTGYSEERTRTYQFNEKITIGNQTRSINVTNHVAAYRKNYSNALPGAFGVLSTPKVEVLGQSINPLGSLDKKTLMKRIVAEVRGIEDLQQTGTGTVEMLGNETKLITFSGTVNYRGRTVNVTAYFARTSDGNDYVIAGGVHQVGVEGGASDVRALIEGITHETG